MPSGKIFMSGLVSMETESDQIERVAGDEAYTKYKDGDFARDGRKWLFFTGLDKIRFFEGVNDNVSKPRAYSPLADAQHVAAYLQEKYERLQPRQA